MVSPDGTATEVVPLIEMPLYLRWLAARVEDLGGTITRLNLSALPSGGDVVVNCSGLGARLLAADHDVQPVQGQVVVVEQFGLDRWWLDPAGPTYVVPRSHDVVVGGTEVRGAWSRSPSPATAHGDPGPRGRAGARAPGRAGAPAQGGSAPGPHARSGWSGRVTSCTATGTVASGVTLSWGTADDVVTLVG